VFMRAKLCTVFRTKISVFSHHVHKGSLLNFDKQNVKHVQGDKETLSLLTVLCSCSHVHD
jgi:hypothetical protein